MIIKAIAKLCKETRNITIFEEEGGTQWISNGYAAFPLHNMPELDTSTVLTVFDIPEKDRGKYLVQRKELPAGLNFDDEDGTERLLRPGNLSIGYAGDILETARTSLGLLFYNAAYLKPLNDLENGYEIYEREDSMGRIYLTAKSGFFLQAVIMPKVLQAPDLADRMEELAAELRTTISYYKARETGDSEEQEDLFHVDPATGEVKE